MKSAKRTFAILMLAALLLAPVPGIRAENAVSGEFEYTVLSDGTAEITAYLGKEEVCVIPETVDGYLVIGLRQDLRIGVREYSEVFDAYMVRMPSVLEIPATVTHIGMVQEEALEGYHDLSRSVTVWKGEWKVSADNPVYRDIDGVLFDRSGETLILYPAGREDEAYAVPEGTQEIRRDAFGFTNKLKELRLPETLQRVGDYAFAGCEDLQAIRIPERTVSIGRRAFPGRHDGGRQFQNIRVSPYNSAYYDVDGVLFSRTDRKLICYPAGRQEAEYDVPEGTRIIGAYAFAYNRALRVLRIPEGVTDLEEMALGASPTKEGLRIYFPASVTQIQDRQFAMDEQIKFTYVVVPGSPMDTYIQQRYINVYQYEYAQEGE
ncbi:MAG: leucine-rich repeat domain-containing protein [Clostridia bacterium]|nr:leucine-rich repeat domain-containing protein [Clostridia bacterium]